MNSTKKLNRTYAAIGESALLIWWGIVIVVDPLTIGIGAVGTGLILLGVNAARYLSRIPTRRATTAVGIIALVWGALDHVLALRFWPSFATLLIVIGVASIASLLVPTKTEQPSQTAG